MTLNKYKWCGLCDEKATVIEEFLTQAVGLCDKHKSNEDNNTVKCDNPWNDSTDTPCGQCEGCLGL